MSSKGEGLTLIAQRQDDGDNKPRCAQCGDFINPVDWCPYCSDENGPCGRPHRRLRKRADAKFCDASCKALYRSSYIRDCL